jgi:hypothetical protein
MLNKGNRFLQRTSSSAYSLASALVAHLEYARVLAAVGNASIAVDDAEA